MVGEWHFEYCRQNNIQELLAKRLIFCVLADRHCGRAVLLPQHNENRENQTMFMSIIAKLFGPYWLRCKLGGSVKLNTNILASIILFFRSLLAIIVKANIRELNRNRCALKIRKPKGINYLLIVIRRLTNQIKLVAIGISYFILLLLPAKKNNGQSFLTTDKLLVTPHRTIISINIQWGVNRLQTRNYEKDIDLINKFKSELIDKLLVFVVSRTISLAFTDKDIIRFLGSTVYAKQTLIALWTEDVKEIQGLGRKVEFAFSRYSECLYFKNKMQTSSEERQKKQTYESLELKMAKI